MPKRGQRHNDASERKKAEIELRHRKKRAQPIITGNYKKKETYAERARLGLAPEPEMPQRPPRAVPPVLRPPKGTRAGHPRSGRSGSDSNASSGTRGH